MRPSNRTTPARTGPKSGNRLGSTPATQPGAKAGEPEQKLAEKQPQQQCNATLANALRSKKKRKAKANEPKIELAGLLERICGVDLTRVVGLNVASVLLIVSEIGVDMCCALCGL
jgi:hypothetical protein